MGLRLRNSGVTSIATNRQPPRWVELLPPGALVVAFAVKAALQPQAVEDAFSGTQAFLVTFAIFVGWALLWLVVLPRVMPNGWLRTGILSVLAGVLIYTLVINALVDKKVVEALPEVKVSEMKANDEPAIGDASPSTTAAPQPVKVASDALVSRGGHDASGTVAIYRQPDGTFVVGLENIDVEPGPDYHVYVVPGQGREETANGGVRLDTLRGNQGTQYYPVPANVAFEPGEWTVLIWCRAFAVPIANSTPT